MISSLAPAHILEMWYKELWKVAAYGTGIGLLVAQGTGSMALSRFWAFAGCLAIGGGLGLTYAIHEDFFKRW